MGCISLWANSRAWTRVSSSTSPASASTMRMASLLPATTRSSWLSSSSCRVGFRTKLPPMRPTRTAAMGPSQGMSESMRAALAAMGPRMSGGFFWSAERTVTMIWTSWRNPLGKRGLMGRSVMRAERMAFSPGRPSRRMKLPGIFPTA